MKAIPPTAQAKSAAATLAALLIALILNQTLGLLSTPSVASPQPPSHAQVVGSVPVTSRADTANPSTALYVSTSSQGNPLGSPSITASKVYSLAVDVNGNTRANPGDTLGYTIAITNAAGGSNALGMNFNDTLDPHTTLVAGSVHASPLAFDDSYTAVGNTLLAVGVTPPAGTPAVQVAGSVLNNDVPLNSESFSLSSHSNPTHGSLVLNTDGTFTYLPNVGYTGADSFTYTIVTAAGLSDTGTVAITVSNMVWYVNNAGANGDGRSTSPFNYMWMSWMLAIPRRMVMVAPPRRSTCWRA